jgi:hypothetical protein
LEDLLPKDHENISLFTDLPTAQSEAQGFAPDQMVRCDDCLRANPPTRVVCLYCGKDLPANAAAAGFQKPLLRPLEKGEQGYNSILSNVPGDSTSEQSIQQAAELLRLAPADLQRLVLAQKPLPLARTASHEEAVLIEQSLRPLGLETRTVSDEALALDALPPQRLRTLELREGGVIVYPTSGEGKQIDWNEVVLVIRGRLFAKQVAVKERRRRGLEKHIVDASETTSDEAVLDFYTRERDGGWRILANNFDFSFLGDEKKLLAGENFAKLSELIRARAEAAQHDDTYNALRRNLELVWPSEQQTSSLGWRRERAGKYSTSEVAVTSNESQFTRYSRLCHFLLVGTPES